MGGGGSQSYVFGLRWQIPDLLLSSRINTTSNCRWSMRAWTRTRPISHDDRSINPSQKFQINLGTHMEWNLCHWLWPWIISHGFREGNWEVGFSFSAPTWLVGRPYFNQWKVSPRKGMTLILDINEGLWSRSFVCHRVQRLIITVLKRFNFGLHWSALRFPIVNDWDPW